MGPRQRVDDTLRLMGTPLDARVDRALAVEVAARDGGIRAVLVGRVEKLGSAWVVSADLVDPRDGVAVASPNEEAQDEEALLPAIQRLSGRVREALGEALSNLEKSDEDLRRVSTTSLRALELYSRADRLFEQGNLRGINQNRAAEALLREAISEDPDFASAYTHLAWAILRQGRGAEEALPYAERAVELAGRAAPVERYFIRGSYHDMRTEAGVDELDADEDAAAEYIALLEIEPDHFWANGNITPRLIALGRHEEALEYQLRHAGLRPYSFAITVQAIRALVELGGRLEETKAYAEHAEKLWREGAGQRRSPVELWFRAYLDFLPIHELWLQGDLEGVVSELDRTVDSLREQPRPAAASALAMNAARYYGDLGMLEKTRQILPLLDPPQRRLWESREAWLTATARASRS